MSKDLLLVSCCVGLLSLAGAYFENLSLSPIPALSTLKQFIFPPTVSFPRVQSKTTWYHPDALLDTPPYVQKGEWNLLYHLGGNGPWIRKVDGVLESDIGPPREGDCRVEQVHMMSRHAERFPTRNAGDRMVKLAARIQSGAARFKGDLAFVYNWTFFGDPNENFEYLTTTGPYAGTLEAFTTGVKLRTRYQHLLPSKKGERTRFWASDSDRVIDTAQYFAAGFFGIDWESRSAELQIIPETADLGADTLTPGDTCLNYVTDLTQGHDYVASRLSKMTSNICFRNDEVYTMQEMCGFEILVRGNSPWCDVFTHDDWLNFEYARDVVHFYRAGPGNRYGPTMGWLWINATLSLLTQGQEAGSFFFSFVHDGDIIPMLSALDIFPDKGLLPLTHVAKDRSWQTSQVTPMGGRTIFELLSCSDKTAPGANRSHFVRLNINDGIVGIPGCDEGPGGSCALSRFVERVRLRGEEVGDFREVCGLGDDMPDRITFLHQG